MKKILENIFFIASEPVTLGQLVETLQIVTPEEIEKLKTALSNLKLEYEQRGLQLNKVGGGYLLTTQPQYRNWTRRHSTSSRTRLSEGGKVTLAIIAYKQPIKKSEIDLIRGVDCESVLQTLQQYKLIHVVGNLSGASLYCTTKLFLKQLNLNSLSELPPIEPKEPVHQGLSA